MIITKNELCILLKNAKIEYSGYYSENIDLLDIDEDINEIYDHYQFTIENPKFKNKKFQSEWCDNIWTFEFEDNILIGLTLWDYGYECRNRYIFEDEIKKLENLKEAKEKQALKNLPKASAESINELLNKYK